MKISAFEFTDDSNVRESPGAAASEYQGHLLPLICRHGVMSIRTGR